MEKEVTAIYDGNSKRYYRYFISAGQDVTGSIYIPKETEIPEKVIIKLKTKADK